MKPSLILVSALALATVGLSACGDKNAPAQNPMGAPVPVNVYTVTEERVVGLDAYPGTIVPLNQVELRAQVGGYLTNVYVQDGQTVSKGQKLYEIDRTNYQAAYSQAQAAVQSARADLERVRQDVQRYENLLAQDAIARQRVDYARAELKTAQAAVASAQAGAASARNNLQFAVITAPMSGRIGISQVKVGSQITPGQTLLNTVSADNPMAVEVVVNAQEIPRFTRLQQKSAADSTFTLQLADGSRYPLPGQIQALDRAVDPQTGTLTVRVGFPNPNRQLIPGMTVSLQVRNTDIGQQLVIPHKAVVEQMGEYYTYVLSGDSVLQKPVQLGTKVADKIVVRDGLKAGDQVVAEGTQKLRPGAKVTLGSPQPAPGPTK